MIIQDIRKKKGYNRTSPKNPFYQSDLWKRIRKGFINSVPWIKLPPINGKKYENRFCADCWEKGIINDERIEIDHVQDLKESGDPYSYLNMRSLCHAHHNAKTNKTLQTRAKDSNRKI